MRIRSRLAWADRGLEVVSGFREVNGGGSGRGGGFRG